MAFLRLSNDEFKSARWHTLLLSTAPAFLMCDPPRLRGLSFLRRRISLDLFCSPACKHIGSGELRFDEGNTKSFLCMHVEGRKNYCFQMIPPL